MYSPDTIFTVRDRALRVSINGIDIALDPARVRKYFEAMCNLMDIPVEIQELILSQLNLLDLFEMSKVCRLWCGICAWIAKEKFSRIIPEECVEEIENSGAPQDKVWLSAIKYHYLQKCITSQTLNQNKSVVAELNEKHLCFCIHGPLIFIGSVSGEIEVYNPEESAEPVFVLHLERAPIFQVEVMTAMNLLLVRTLMNEIAFLTLPYHTGKSWVYQMTLLKPNVVNFDGKILAERNFSLSGVVLASVIDPRQLCVFQVTSVTNNAVDLRFLANYLTEEPIGHVSLWRDEVIVIFKTGGILRWCLSTLVSFLSERYYELHYENPIWIFRGRIFCSTIFSSQLLGYWHMDRGARYWLTGRPSSDLVRCRDLGTAVSSDLSAEEVLCVCLKQRLLACGTRNGKILLYCLSDTFFSEDDFNENGNDHLTREFNRAPDLTIRTKERPISNIQIQFTENSIAIYTWPCRMQSRPELKGLLQRVVLTEARWAGQRDRDSIHPAC